MKRNLNTLLVSMGVLCFSGMESRAQIALLKDYQNFTSAPIGTYKGINYREAGFSSLYAIPGTNGKEFWTISDRGVNIDCGNANLPECRPGYDKMYAFPSYAPKIHRIRVSGDSVQILQTISMKRPDGTGAVGLLNPTGFGSTAKESNPTDTVLNCANLALKTAPKDVWGIDSEGLIVDKDGNFWISEEGGPTIWKLNKNGVVVKRFTPYAPTQPQDVQIDTVFKYRKNNRGFEALAITPNGKLYALIQSPLLFPTKAIGEATQVHRLLEIDLATNATRVLLYLNDGVIGASGANQIRFQDWKIGDMTAINDTTFLVIEAALRGTSDFKKIYKINITGATAVSAGLYGTKTVEGLVNADSLAKYNIVPVKKTLFLDLLANGWPSALDKSEGLAIINDSTIAVSNDNDYGQECPAADGLATATGKLSHVLVYGLKGANKLQHLHQLEGVLAEGQTGPSTSQSPYLVSAAPGVKVTSLLTTGEKIGGYTMVGTPDGMGAYDNGNGTFTVLINHEFTSTAGVERAHGSKGALVSKWVINKADLSVVSGSDLIKRVHTWNPVIKTYVEGTTAFNRFCSADLPAVSAFYNALSGKGTQNRIFMNGEESGNEGRGFAHIVTGDSAGVSYELPYLGKFSWENSVASPSISDRTVVVGLDDATPGQVYVYVGEKSSTGNDIEKAGLVGGKLYGVTVEGLTAEVNASVPTAGTKFTLTEVPNIRDSSGLAINNISNNLGITNFLRPEDGAWDPSNPNDFYFATTNGFSANSRLWRLSFADATDPVKGGTITAVLEGAEGQKMLDNLTIDHHGRILLVEDVGNNAHVGKTWQYHIATDQLTLVASHDTTRFLTGGANFLTQDEEASGILDVESILGEGMFLVVDQAHYSQPGELVEGGQLLALYNPLTVKGVSSSQTPYLVPEASGVKITSLFTTGDEINGYKMAGTPDGLGAYDNNDGTFTVLMNHEFNATAGTVRAHGSKGAFVSKWVIRKSDHSVVGGSDLIKRVHVWNPVTKAYVKETTAFNRFCSADLPAVSAFYNATTGKGTQNRIFMNGEESGNEGRGFAHIVTGDSAGVSFELPYMGKLSWENAVASPTASDKTVVVGLDDSTPGQVYVYVGNKSETGNDIEKAGLTGGKLYGVTVEGLTAEVNASVPAAGTNFTLTEVPNVRDSSGLAINNISNSLGVTTFLRPEDGAWDPSNPKDFYFATTNGFSANSRLWRLRFADPANPVLGGTITAVLEGNEGQKMLDNLTIDHYGHVLLVEDVGNNAHIGKTWQYSIATDELKLIASHDTTRFLTGGSKFLTQDEEASGILDVQDILGAGYFLVDDQAHYAQPGELVEGGQLLLIFNPDTYKASQISTDLGSDVYLASGSDVFMFPNPTNNTATISMNLESASKVVVTIFDSKGSPVALAMEQNLSAGKQQIVLETADLENGIYFVQVATGTKTVRIKAVVLH